MKTLKDILLFIIFMIAVLLTVAGSNEFAVNQIMAGIFG